MKAHHLDHLELLDASVHRRG